MFLAAKGGRKVSTVWIRVSLFFGQLPALSKIMAMRIPAFFICARANQLHVGLSPRKASGENGGISKADQQTVAFTETALNDGVRIVGIFSHFLSERSSFVAAAEGVIAHCLVCQKRRYCIGRWGLIRRQLAAHRVTSSRRLCLSSVRQKVQTGRG